MKSIRRSFMYVFAIICGLTLCGNAVLADGMVKGNLVVSGDVEVNTNVITEDMGGVKSTINSQTGRAKLKFEANSGMMGNLYVAGEGAIEAKQDGDVSGGDYFFRLGGSDWDLTVGRKGGEGLYTSGQDIAYADARGPGRYAVDYASQAAVGGFNLTFSPSDVMKFQLRIQNGTVEDADDATKSNNQLGFRPWMSVSLGGIGIVAAYESVSESAQDSGRGVEQNKSGYGIKVTGDVGAIKLGVNYTSGNDADDVTTNSTGGFVTVDMMAGSFGIGLHRDSKEDASEQNTFVSYVAPLPVEGSHIKVGYGVSKAGDNEAGLFRIRFNYAF